MYSRKLDWPGICFLNGVGLVDSWWCWISEMIENPVKVYLQASHNTSWRMEWKFQQQNESLFISEGRKNVFPFLGHAKTCPGNFDKLNANGILDWVMLGSKLKQPFLLEHFKLCFSNQENMLRL